MGSRKPKGYCTEKLGMTPTEDSIEYQRRWRAANPDSFKFWKYGITQEEYLAKLEKQNFKCGICGTSSPGGRHDSWHIDHNHETNQVRGLLCWLCNSGLGKFKDSVNILTSAVEYLKKHKS